MATKKSSTKKTTVRKKRSPKKNQDKIYIQIASYRDPELLPTIADALDKAKYPKNLVFGICWQHSPYDEWDNLDDYINDERFRIIDMDYRDAKGVPYARNLINKLWKGEKYTLQLDSHHRFAQDWDDILINMLEGLRSKTVKKPLLSSYVPSYQPNMPLDQVTTEHMHPAPWMMEFDRFSPEGPVHFLPHGMDELIDVNNLDVPAKARFISAHFIFADGKYCKEVEYDPEFYFHGEEINLSVRSYMAGYDLFAPNITTVWHEYTRNGKKKHWDDHVDWSKIDTNSHRHGRELLGIDSDDTEKILTGERSLYEYEKYAGIEFRTRKVHKDTLEKKRPPVATDDEYHKNNLLSFQKYCIDIYKGDLPEDDYTVIVVAFEDENENEIFREDAVGGEIKQILSTAATENSFCQIWRQFYLDTQPTSWVVWAHSETKGWGERLAGKFPKD